MPDADLVTAQTVEGSPVPRGTSSSTSPLLPARRVADRLAHFSEDVYDITPESHLSRFMKVLLGDAGAGQLRKRLTVTRLAQTLTGTHFLDLDRFFGALFGATRLTAERLGFDPYTGLATVDEWDAAHAKDASYRSRMAAFARALAWGPTPTGIELAAEALLAVDCDVFETWIQSDAGYRTYAELEALYNVINGYAAMEGLAYSALEGIGLGQISKNDRREFTVRPKRPVSLEEMLVLNRVDRKSVV